MPSDSKNNILVLTERTFKLQSHYNAYWGSSITVRVLLLFVIKSTSCPLQFKLIFFLEQSWANPGGHAVYGVGLRPLICCDCGFQSHQGHGRLSLVSAVCCQVEVSALGWSLVQRIPAECGVSNWKWMWRLNNEEPWPTKGCCAMKKIEQSQRADFQLPSCLAPLENTCCQTRELFSWTTSNSSLNIFFQFLHHTWFILHFSSFANSLNNYVWINLTTGRSVLLQKRRCKYFLHTLCSLRWFERIIRY